MTPIVTSSDANSRLIRRLYVPLGLANYGINPWTIVLDLISAQFVGGLRLTPSGASHPPQVFIDPLWFSLKKWFYHKSSTGFDWGMDVNVN